ncbi:hypothetical protein [Enterococcus avium]|uniref:hypothetical protein n=1 Tax=Enterococcus avium TaxID=33945 RepID=UPI001F55C192|nr:hypothetical protein [Enterococcus avium]
MLKNNYLKEYLKLIYCSEGITYEEFCLKVSGSISSKNKWFRFLVHHHYIYKDEISRFYLNEAGKNFLNKL